MAEAHRPFFLVTSSSLSERFTITSEDGGKLRGILNSIKMSPTIFQTF